MGERRSADLERELWQSFCIPQRLQSLTNIHEMAAWPLPSLAKRRALANITIVVIAAFGFHHD